jgi:hypothetical protein
MTKQKELIRGVYPTDGGRIALRTDESWDSNIEAGSAGQNGCVSEFRIETAVLYMHDGHNLFFKEGAFVGFLL